MTRIDAARLASTLGKPELARLVAALRRRLELGRPVTGSLTLMDVTPEERAACDALLGRKPSRGDTLTLELDALAYRLETAGICPNLVAAVEALTGPVINQLEANARHLATWESSWSELRARPTFTRHPSMGPWLEELRDSGVVKRLCQDNPLRAVTLMEHVERLTAVLPVEAEPLAALAARVFGNAHALDPGTPLATLAVRAAARIGSIAFEDHAEGRRSAWASVGVMCDELSTPVLVFQLRSGMDSPLARLLRAAAADAEPLHLSLRLLMRHPVADDSTLRGQVIFACENPTIVTLAAGRLGTRCAPLVCVNGQFATPALVLLRQLRQAGARVRYHGDFDPGGLAIARRVFAEAGAEPWQFGVEDYEDAYKGVPFPGEPGDTPWSPFLAESMRATRRAVHEEAVFETLARDLDRGS